MKSTNSNSRRNFIGKVALGSTVAGLTGLVNPVIGNQLKEETIPMHEADEWFKKIKGSHRVVYDGSTPHDGFPIIWNWAFYLTNNQTGSPDSDITAMTVIRHSAIPFAFEDRLWAKYKLGEVFGINDKATGKPSIRNPYYEPKEGDFPMPVIQGIKDLQARGALFCVCDLAMQVYSGVIAGNMNLKMEDVYADLKSGVHPGIQVVPSGVWALGRAQEHGSAYIFAGG
jgi:intracellular sulfur oxidation DsrE/DsrF family protein